MKIRLLYLAILCFVSTTTYAQTITDVPKTDGAYTVIQQSVKDGYLSLFSENTFRPNQPVNRKELAIVIDSVLRDAKQQNISLSKAEIQELEHLSKSFKSDFISMDTQLKKLVADQSKTNDEITTLHHDLSSINAELKGEIAALKEQRKMMWLAIIGATLFGIAL